MSPCSQLPLKHLAALAVTALVACGDSAPAPSTGPTSPAPPQPPTTVTLTVVSGEDGQPVSGATLTAGGRTLETAANGTASVPVPALGSNVEVIAEGFLDRKTVYRSVNRIVLWPATSENGLTPELTRRLVYSGFGEDAVLGELSMRRPPSDAVIHVFVEGGLLDDVRVNRVVGDAVAAMETALQGRVQIVVTGTPPSSGTVWHIRVDPEATSSEFIATTRFRVRNGEMVEAWLLYRSLSDLAENERLVTNMLGNAFGLRDSDSPNDRMFFDWWRRRPNDFSPRERLIMRLMFERPGGNRWPDNDRSLGASASTQQVRRYQDPPGR